MPPVTDAERRAPRRDAAANRESLLTAAATTLAAAPDASLATIAAAAGLSRRAVYGHFADRDELVLALVDRGAARLNETATTVDHADAAVAIALLAARLWDALEHVSLLAAMAVRDPYVDRVASALAPVRERLLALVERGAAEGSLRRDIRSDLLARLIERAAIAVLLEAADDRVDPSDGHRLVVLAVLGTAGIGWREAGELLTRTPELAQASTEESGAAE